MADPRYPIRSPWSSTSLTRIALADLTGLNPAEVSRADAMKIPGIVRGRGLICGTLSRYPLALFQDAKTGNPDDDVRLPALPWMRSTTTGISPITRMLWTLDDILFSGLSVWATERDESNQITDAIRVAPGYWTPDPDSLGVLINGQPAKSDEVIVFEGPQEGIITIAGDHVEASRDMANAKNKRLKSPIPLVTITQTDENSQLSDDEIDDIIADAELARQKGTTVFIPPGFKLEAVGQIEADLFIEARNAERLDWGNFLNIPAAMLDGSMSTATLTYSTQEGKRSEFVDYSLSYWASAIEARLSQDDVTPEGTYVRFDLSWLTNPTQNGTSPGEED